MVVVFITNYVLYAKGLYCVVRNSRHNFPGGRPSWHMALLCDNWHMLCHSIPYN